MAAGKPAFGSANEPGKLINIALKFTRGDVEKARKMIAGNYNDAAVIKGRFAIDSKGVFGIFLIFLNIPGKYLLNLNALIVPNAVISESVRIFDAWKFFYTDFLKLVEREGSQANASYEFTSHLADSLNGYDIFTDVENDSPEHITGTIREILHKFYGTAPSLCQIEMETASSLSVELEGIPVETPDETALSGESEIIEEKDRRLEAIENQADFVIPGKVIVSPVRGKFINDVKIGESIRIQLLEQDQVSLKVASLLNALTEEGEFLPIKGRVKEKLPQEKSGYIMYALVAKNVLAKIIEEENVKIEMEGTDTEVKADKSDGKLILYIVLLAGLFLAALVVIIALL